MHQTEQSLRSTAKVALAAMAVLLVGSVVFYKERLFADTSFIGFSIINSGDFAIQHGRYGSFITQLLPMLGEKMHLPLSTLLIAYSVSFSLFYFGVAAVLFGVRQYRFVILLALYNFLFITHSYYWACTEVAQAVAWLFLCFGITVYLGHRRVSFPVILLPFLLFCYLTISTHLVTVIPAVFLWVYLIIEREHWPFTWKKTLLLSLGFIAVIAAKYFASTHNAHPYEGGIIHDATHFSLRDIFHAFRTPVIYMFAQRNLTIYLPALLVFIAGITVLYKQGARLLALWALMATVGYIVIMGLAFGKQDENMLLFHIEAEWASLAIIAAAPFVFAALPRMQVRTGVWLLAGIFIIRSVFILASYPVFNWRLQFQEMVFAQMRKKGITKLAIYEEDSFRKKLMLPWALPEETLLLSSMAGDKPTLTFMLVNPDDKETIGSLVDFRQFRSAFGSMDGTSLNKQYFSIDTTSYRLMHYSELFK